MEHPSQKSSPHQARERVASFFSLCHKGLGLISPRPMTGTTEICRNGQKQGRRAKSTSISLWQEQPLFLVTCSVEYPSSFNYERPQQPFQTPKSPTANISDPITNPSRLHHRRFQWLLPLRKPSQHSCYRPSAEFASEYPSRFCIVRLQLLELVLVFIDPALTGATQPTLPHIPETPRVSGI